MKLYQRLRTKLTLGFLVVTLLPATIIGSYAIRISSDALRERELNHQIERLKTLKYQIETFLASAQSDLIFLSHSQPLSDYLTKRSQTPDSLSVELARQAVEQEFLAFSQSRKIYYQVRYLDETGQEIVRIDADGQSQFWKIDLTKLQNKADRYYFTNTMRLPDQELFVSSLDLNQEGGRIEVPYRPVLRYAINVYYPDKRKAGIAIANIDAKQFLQYMGETWLIDAEGYYLAHPQANKCWGSQRDLKTGASLTQDYSELAIEILGLSEGNLHTNDVTLFFQRITVPGLGYWTLVRQQPTTDLLNSVITFQITFGIILLIALLLALAISLLFTHSITHPIESLTTFVKQVQSGERHLRMVDDRKDEIGQLEKGLNAMLNAINSSEEALQKAKQDSETANVAKSRFLANMSHELRTPLNAIIGYGEMLQEEIAELGQPEMSGDMAKIHQAGKHLLGIINDILDISKIEAGRMELYLETFFLPNMVNDIAHTIQPLLMKNKNTLEVHLAAEVGEMHADLTKVRQIILNLLSNACKFSLAGDTVVLEVALSTNANEILFRVRDRGIGMSSEQRQCVFEIFKQADASSTRKYGGMGLGLAITKYFVDMMGGHIDIDSELGSGSTFTVYLPATVATIAGPSSYPATYNSALEEGSLVLVIDDDSAVRSVLKKFLSHLGYQVEVAESGEEGLRLARNFLPDVIILDVMMPRMDGWEVLSYLKADHKLTRIPVIILSMIEDKNIGYSLGATDYLIKPITREQLSAVLQKYRFSTEDSNQLILIVDDDAVTRDMLGRMLRREGWKISKADSARVALNSLQKRQPDLIISDLQMPEMDGFEFILRLSKSYPHLPLLVITAEDLTVEDRLRLKQCNVSAYFQKGSYDRDELVAEVRKVLKTKQEPKT